MDTEWHGEACQGMPGHAKACLGMAWHAMPWNGMRGGRAGGRAGWIFVSENPKLC